MAKKSEEKAENAKADAEGIVSPGFLRGKKAEKKSGAKAKPAKAEKSAEKKEAGKAKKAGGEEKAGIFAPNHIVIKVKKSKASAKEEAAEQKAHAGHTEHAEHAKHAEQKVHAEHKGDAEHGERTEHKGHVEHGEHAAHAAGTKEKHAEHGGKAEHGGQTEKGGKKKGVPSWVELKPQEIFEAIINLANAGHSGSEIGMLLRDQYGVPGVKQVTGKTIEDILKENNLQPTVPEDLMNLIRKSVALRKHLAKNKKDMSAKRGLQLTVSKIRALVRYYKKSGRLPPQWQYTEETAALLVK
ncbi:MAG: 30S ribosomal protein S15 [Candidatus Diapherotrites archaeon]|nr:30S ribosomal protein S15 [Candidatus Diapherotrites archaeon]